ncbi:MAG: hypothetical protein ACK5F7_06810 [Planctomycetaceae bacterium]
MAETIPERDMKGVLQRTDAFVAFAPCGDDTLEKLMPQMGHTPKLYQKLQNEKLGKQPPRQLSSSETDEWAFHHI